MANPFFRNLVSHGKCKNKMSERRRSSAKASESSSKQNKMYEWEPEIMLKPDVVLVLCGARGSGKTWLQYKILHAMRKRLDMCVVFCPTADTRKTYYRCIQKCFIYPEFTKSRLHQIYEVQKMLAEINEGGKGRETEHRTDTDLRRLGIILDDCSFDKKEHTGKALEALTRNGRHENIFYCEAIQQPQDMPKNLRSQLDVIILFKTRHTKDVLDYLVGGVFKNEAELDKILSHLRPYEALVIDIPAFNQGRPYLFYIKAPNPDDIPPFLMGSKQFWYMYYATFKRQSKHEAKRKLHKQAALLMGQTGGPNVPDGEEEIKRVPLANKIALEKDSPMKLKDMPKKSASHSKPKKAVSVRSNPPRVAKKPAPKTPRKKPGPKPNPFKAATPRKRLGKISVV